MHKTQHGRPVGEESVDGPDVDAAYIDVFWKIFITKLPVAEELVTGKRRRSRLVGVDVVLLAGGEGDHAAEEQQE